MEKKYCNVCNREVLEANGNLVHNGGGEFEQKCMNCGWTGGQVGKFSTCPSCGNQTSLVDTHRAQV